jgi:hypothetical protein
MFYLVFSNEDKEKMLHKGATFVCAQGGAFLFNIKDVNFDINNIKCIKVNDINF